MKKTLYIISSKFNAEKAKLMMKIKINKKSKPIEKAKIQLKITKNKIKKIKKAIGI